MSGGYLDWSADPARNALTEPPVIAGIQQVGIGIEPSGTISGGGVRLEKFGGFHVRHYTAAHPNAPLSGGMPSGLSLSTGEYSAISDWHQHLRIPAQSMLDDIEVLLRLETSDSWKIAAGRSLWTPSFKMGYGTAIAASFSPALAAPVVRVFDSANVVQKTLTVVAAAPAAGEVQVDQTTDSQLLTTFDGDLDANAGQRLVVEYTPLLSCTVPDFQWEREVVNIIRSTLELDITPLEQDWGADTP